MKTLSLWVWYLVLVIVVWILLILPALGGLPLLTALLAASLFAVTISLSLLPFYLPLATTDYDQTSIDVFVVVITVIPIILLFTVILTGEYKLYWGGKNLHQAVRPDLYGLPTE